MEEKEYTFTVTMKVKNTGAIFAKSEEDAIKKILNWEYDEMIDSEPIEIEKDTLKIEKA